MKKDIEARADIDLLVNQFYNKVNRDTLLAPVFSHVDWPHHLPIMYNFWSSILLGDQSYQGNPFQKHVHLGISAAHFGRWLDLFTATVDENFGGVKAEETKVRARNIAGVFQHKMGLLTP
jgi:hemoglobin